MSRRPAYLRAQGVADLLGVSVRTVRRWIADGILPSTLIGGSRLIAEEDLALALCGGVADLATDDDEGTTQKNQSVI
jgi:excisionase family DNA binding protein